MKFAPRRSRIIGRMVIRKSESKIILVDETKVTKFVLIDAIGPDAAEKGLKVGDVVLPIEIRNIVLDGGKSFRPIMEEENVAFVITGMRLDDLSVQVDSGKQFVPFDSPEAAESFGSQDEAIAKAAE